MAQRVSDLFKDLQPYIVGLINDQIAAIPAVTVVSDSSSGGGGGGGGTGGIIDADYVGGIDAGRIVYGDNATKTSNISDFNAISPSGFYNGNGATGAPTAATWYYLLNIEHTNAYVGNQYQLQLAHEFWGTDLYHRTISVSGGIGAWKKLANIGDDATFNALITTSQLLAQDNTDTQHALGMARIGSVGYSTPWAGFAHRSVASVAGNYALMQSNAGQTALNAAAGSTVNHRINNSDVLSMSSNTLTWYGLTSFQTNGFVSGFTGSGLRLDNGVLSAGRTSGELDDLIVRGRMRVYELLIHQIRATNGNVFVSSAGKVKSVSGAGPYVIISDTDHGFAVNDLIRAQRFTGTGVYQSNLQVTAVASSTQFTATLSSGDAPASGMEFVRIGNTTDTTRQGTIYLTADDTYAPYIDVVDGVAAWADWGASAKIKARLGRLTGITDTALNPSGYGLYSQNVFLKGDLVTGNGYLRLTQASGIDIQEDADSWSTQRAIQWWPNVNSPSGSPSLAIYEYKVSSGLTANQNFAYVEAYPNGGVMSTLWMDAHGQGGAGDAYIYLQGGSAALSTAQIIVMGGDISVNGGLAVKGGASETALGADNVRFGVIAGTPRLLFEDATYTMREIDNAAGVLRFFHPGVVDMTLDTSGNLVVTGGISAGGQIGSNWTTLSYGTGWASYGSPFPAMQYRKFGDIVELAGLAKRTSGSNANVGTLPAGYRPANQKMFATIVHNGTAEIVCRLDVDTAGNIVCITNPATINYLALDVVRFSTLN